MKSDLVQMKRRDALKVMVAAPLAGILPTDNCRITAGGIPYVIIDGPPIDMITAKSILLRRCKSCDGTSWCTTCGGEIRDAT